MRQRQLGDNGPVVSRLAYGAMTFGSQTDEESAPDLLDFFVESGGSLIDTSDNYQNGTSERFIGRWLAARAGMRDRIVLATKGRYPVDGQPGAALTPDYLRTALNASLRRLGVDQIDVYQVHGPDAKHPVDGAVEFFAEAVRAGKIRYAGVSNMTGWQLAKLGLLCAEAGVNLVSHQPQYSLLAREVEWEVMPAAIDAGLGTIPWGPLAAGWLTGKYHRDANPSAGTRLGDNPGQGLEAWERRGSEQAWATIETLRAVADRHGVTPAQAAVAWIADRPGVTAPIVGARSVAQLRETLAAAELRLDAAATAELDRASAPATPDYPYQFLAEISQW